MFKMTKKKESPEIKALKKKYDSYKNLCESDIRALESIRKQLKKMRGGY